MLKVHNLNFKELLEKCSLEFKETDYRISCPLDSEVEFLKGKNFIDIWKVETCLYDDVENKWLIEELVLYIGFTSNFPYKIPKIYIGQNNLKQIGTIPHITQKDSDICLFDNFAITDINNPIGIILEILDKAKKTLEKGIKKGNFEDFESEFTAYWTAENNITLKKVFYFIINNFPQNSNYLNALVYNKNEKLLTYIIYNKDEKLIDKYKNYLKLNGINYTDVQIFFLGETQNIKNPPFEFTYKESIGLIPSEKLKDFKNYFNKADSEKKVLFTKKIQGKDILCGWTYKRINKSKINGFRQESLNDYLIAFGNFFPGQKEIIRKFNVDNIGEKRLVERTSTDKLIIPKSNFLVAGLGSVGSLLVSHLNSLNFPNFTLIDFDSLGAENIGRHFLGFDDLNIYKTDSINKFLNNKNPSQNVKVYRESFINVYKNNVNVFNNQDYIFLCTGEKNLEESLFKEIEKENIEKPLFRIWVEPFLLGGHFIYMTPQNPVDIDNLYSENSNFKYSVIQDSEYTLKRDLFIQKEIGCQSTFSPYSSAHLDLFISSVYIEIFKIIQSKEEKSIIVSWTGDLEFAKEMGIKTNVGLNSFEIKKTVL